VPRGTLLGEPEVDRIVQAGIQEVRIRSVLHLRRPQTACAPPATAAISRAGRPSTCANGRRHRGAIDRRAGTHSPCATPHRRAAQISEQSFIESNYRGTIRVQEPRVVRNSSGDSLHEPRNMAIVVVDQDGTERAVHRSPVWRPLEVRRAHIKRGQRIAEWDSSSDSDIDWPLDQILNPIVPSTSVRMCRMYGSHSGNALTALCGRPASHFKRRHTGCGEPRARCRPDRPPRWPCCGSCKRGRRSNCETTLRFLTRIVPSKLIR